MNSQSADPHGSLGGFLDQPGIDQPAEKERDDPNQMRPTEKSQDERFEMSGRPGRGSEKNSRDSVVRVERQAHRQLAALAMQSERDPSAVVRADWAVEFFDVADLRDQPSVKIGRFLRRKRLAHLRVVQLLHGGVIARVEQINDRSSDDGVAIGLFGANALRRTSPGPVFWSSCLDFPWSGRASKEPHSNKADFAPKGELPKGDLEFSRLNLVGGRHRENDWAQIRDVRFIQRLAGFGRTEQRFQLCFEGKKLFGPCPLIEPVDERIYGNENQRAADFGKANRSADPKWRSAGRSSVEANTTTAPNPTNATERAPNSAPPAAIRRSSRRAAPAESSGECERSSKR